MQLTEHFSLEEFTYSFSAKRLGLDNTVPLHLIPSMKNLCQQVLEPLRAYAGMPVIISSGYRCPQLNEAVGGVGNSQHLKGEAADIQPPFFSPRGELYSASQRKAILHDWFVWLKEHTHVDQLLYEKSATATWIHVSCKLDASQNRQHVLQLTKHS